MKHLRGFVLVWGLLWTLAAPAAEVRDLYEAEVPVADQQVEARQAAIRAGLAEVLVRATGYSGMAQDPALADLLDNAPRYLQQYRYRAAPPTTLPMPDGTVTPWVLWMSFDANNLHQLLRERGKPVWGKARPLLLVWLAVEDGTGRRLVGAAESGLEQYALEAAARRRGLPLRLPLLDLEDRARVSAGDVWGGFHDTVTSASARYNPQAVLIGRLYRDSRDGWRARWTLRVGDEVMNWDSTAGDPASALALGVDGSADTLSLRFAQVGAAGASADIVTLRITDVSSLAAYARVLTYLRSLNGVTDVQVEQVGPTVLTCRLSMEVATAAVVRTIGLGTTLAAVPVVPVAGAPLTQPPAELNYRLMP